MPKSSSTSTTCASSSVGWDVDQHRSDRRRRRRVRRDEFVIEHEEEEKIIIIIIIEISDVSSNVQHEYSTPRKTRRVTPLEASMELCDTLKLEERGGPENASGDVRRNAAMGRGMDAIPDIPGAMDCCDFEKKSADGAGDVHEQRRTDEENEQAAGRKCGLFRRDLLRR